MGPDPAAHPTSCLGPWPGLKDYKWPRDIHLYTYFWRMKHRQRYLLPQGKGHILGKQKGDIIWDGICHIDICLMYWEKQDFKIAIFFLKIKLDKILLAGRAKHKLSIATMLSQEFLELGRTTWSPETFWLYENAVRLGICAFSREASIGLSHSLGYPRHFFFKYLSLGSHWMSNYSQSKYLLAKNGKYHSWYKEEWGLGYRRHLPKL